MHIVAEKSINLFSNYAFSIQYQFLLTPNVLTVYLEENN